jgi:hypothetical protein
MTGFFRQENNGLGSTKAENTLTKRLFVSKEELCSMVLVKTKISFLLKISTLEYETITSQNAGNTNTH